MNWFIVDKNYIRELGKIDSHVPYIDYENAVKPYIGIVLDINEFHYYVPISSPKPKHATMKNSKTFIKVNDKNGKLLSVLNLSNMVPIPEHAISRLNYDTIDKHRPFKNQYEKEMYVALLRDELNSIKQMKGKILKAAAYTYNHVKDNPFSNISKNSCDFRKLEEHLKTLEKSSTKEQITSTVPNEKSHTEQKKETKDAAGHKKEIQNKSPAGKKIPAEKIIDTPER